MAANRNNPFGVKPASIDAILAKPYKFAGRPRAQYQWQPNNPPRPDYEPPPDPPTLPKLCFANCSTNTMRRFNSKKEAEKAGFPFQLPAELCKSTPTKQEVRRECDRGYYSNEWGGAGCYTNCNGAKRFASSKDALRAGYTMQFPDDTWCSKSYCETMKYLSSSQYSPCRGSTRPAYPESCKPCYSNCQTASRFESASDAEKAGMNVPVSPEVCDARTDCQRRRLLAAHEPCKKITRLCP